MSKVRSCDVNRAFSDVQGAVVRYQPSGQRCPRCGGATATEQSTMSKSAVSDVSTVTLREATITLPDATQPKMPTTFCNRTLGISSYLMPRTSLLLRTQRHSALAR